MLSSISSFQVHPRFLAGSDKRHWHGEDWTHCHVSSEAELMWRWRQRSRRRRRLRLMGVEQHCQCGHRWGNQSERETIPAQSVAGGQKAAASLEKTAISQHNLQPLIRIGKLTASIFTIMEALEQMRCLFLKKGRCFFPSPHERVQITDLCCPNFDTLWG